MLDMKPYLSFGVFKKIQDPSIFKTAHISFDAIAWECGADLDPEFVYRQVLYRTTKRFSRPLTRRLGLIVS